MNPKVDWYFEKNEKWGIELHLLRDLILDCQLTEELKWGVPTYTYKSTNVVLIHAFKDYCAILFPQGVLLKDTYGILIQQTENVQAARQIRFKAAADINRLKEAIKEYVYQACELADSGQKMALKKTADYIIPEELKLKMGERPDLKRAFEALTPGRQRAYLLYFAQAKQSKTVVSRIEKYTETILMGKGIND